MWNTIIALKLSVSETCSYVLAMVRIGAVIPLPSIGIPLILKAQTLLFGGSVHVELWKRRRLTLILALKCVLVTKVIGDPFNIRCIADISFRFCEYHQILEEYSHKYLLFNLNFIKDLLLIKDKKILVKTS